ncbi:DUF1002 domain-containing protein [Ornithinibacillus halophilus]|uniref:Uncharacterized protein YpuA, DUF1002 family n=1 Tax=Ornithinibacillus halophilus TaxID=930117 RepID=A0A1M5IC71_9BACI|nr:DUF1002 domain-containing protein [Ornithinibacillus halophilus]SHG25978.1 Uncharacterized protein YpuA, DUF1002 family [Ornithinibacillus halophilus]
MKRTFKTVVMSLLMIGFIVGIMTPIHAEESINEKLGVPIVVYGDNLTDEQKEKTRELLDVTNPEMVDEYNVTGQDLANYINGNPNARMFSSAKITMEEEGEGLTVNIVTPENITEVTNEMYSNALLTAGVENATVEVVSPVKVSGHSALTGIYKAYDVQGEELDKARMELANEELGVATDLAEDAGVDKDKVSELLTEIKKSIAEQNPASIEEIEQIITEKLNELEISLSEEDRQRLIDLFEKMRELDIDFDKVKSQLDDIASKVQDKIEDIINDEGFWKKVGNFFNDFFQLIKEFFTGLFN